MEKRKKRNFLFLFAAFALILLITPKISQAALGITPSMIDVNFEPNLEKEFTFKVIGDDPSQKLEIYAAGEFTESVSFDKTEFDGGGIFTVKLKLPEKIDVPGKHRILIGAREKPKPEEGIGTLVAVQTPIDIYVPYPGKYAEIEFTSQNVNVGEPVVFRLLITSRGKEEINTESRIEIFSQEEKIETLYLGQTKVKSQTSEEVKKTLDTSNYKSGLYTAIAIVDYEAGTVKATSEFKIGTLFVNVVNYTSRVLIGGIKKFEMQIESNWNNKMDNIYADVSIAKNSKQNQAVLASLRTPSTSIGPWGKTTIVGFFDTSNFTKGFYDANITLFYVDKSSSEVVSIELYKETSKFLEVGIIIVAIVLLIVIIAFLIKRFKKSKLKGIKKEKRK